MEAPEYEYDVAVSFAGEDREFVETVVRALDEHEVTTFYDRDASTVMWVHDLVDFLQVVYQHKTRFAVLFISSHYVAKKWPGYERRLTQDRAMRQSAPYVLPVRLDDTPVPGLPATLSYLDARVVGADGIVAAILEKLGSPRAEPAGRFNGRVPRTAEETSILLSERPPAWEYILYAGVLRQGIDALEGRYRDHVLEYAPRNGTFLDADTAFTTIRQNLTTLENIGSDIERVISPEAQEWAFGEDGQDGDPERITHLGQRLISIYEDFLTFAAKLRGADVLDKDLALGARLQARVASRPLEIMRDFVNDYTSAADEITASLLRGEQVELEFRLVMQVDSALLAEVRAAVNRYAGRRDRGKG